MSGLSRALVGLAVAGFALGLAALALVTTSDREDDPGPWVVLALTMGWSFIGAGSTPGGGGRRTASAR